MKNEKSGKKKREYDKRSILLDVFFVSFVCQKRGKTDKRNEDKFGADVRIKGEHKGDERPQYTLSAKNEI